MHPAPYIIVGFEIPPNDPNAGAILNDIQTEMPRASTFIQLLPNVGVVSIAGAPHDCLDDVINFFVNLNQAYGGVIVWFAQLCGQAWMGREP